MISELHILLDFFQTFLKNWFLILIDFNILTKKATFTNLKRENLEGSKYDF